MSVRPVRPVSSSARSPFLRFSGTVAQFVGQAFFAPNSRTARAASFLTILLVAIALVSLQLSFLGRALLFQLPGYAILGVATLLACAALQWKVPADRACLYSAALFGGYLCIRALTSPAPYFARADLYCVLAALTLYLLIATTIVSSSRRIGLLILLLAFAVYHVLVGIVQFGVGENFLGLPFLRHFEAGTRASGFYGNPDHLAGLLEVLGVLALSVTCWARRPRWVKVLIGYLALVCYIGIAMTASRGGYLSAAVSLVTFLIFSGVVLISGREPEFRIYRKVAAAVLIAGLAAAVFLIQQSPAVQNRIAAIVSPDQTRFDLWRASITQWKLQPAFGTGSGTYRFYGREFRTPRMQSDPVVVHNDYLHLLCEYGLIGAGCFLLFLAAHVRSGWRSFLHYGPERVASATLPISDRLAFTIGALSAIAACAVHSVVDFNMHIQANALIMAFVFGVLANPGRINDSQASAVPTMLGARVAVIVIAIVLLVRSVILLPGEYIAEQARVALEDEDPASAVTLANKALVYEQKNPNIFFYLGRALGALGNRTGEFEESSKYHELALDSFNRARLLAPREEGYPLDMAYTYDQLGRFSEAEWMYGIASDLDPRSKSIMSLYESHLHAWRASGPQDIDAGSATAP